MAVIGSFGFAGISGQFDMNSESMLGALESTSFAPSPFAVAAVPTPGLYQIGTNPLAQILPVLMGALQGLGQGWSQYGGTYGGGYTPAPPPPMQHGGGGCHGK